MGKLSAVFFLIWMSGLSFPLTGVLGQQAPGPEIEDRVTELLAEMSSFLAGIPRFGLELEESNELYDDGQLLHLNNTRTLLVRRPNRAKGRVRSDQINRSFWYDGRNFVMLDDTHNVYQVNQAPDTIEGFLDYLEEQFDLVSPLGHLLFRDLSELVRQGARSGKWGGIHEVDGVRCHHLVFVHDQFDWQLWVTASGRPLPRKLVVTFKSEPGNPQYTAILKDWDFALEAPDSLFEFQPPPGARKIDLTVPGPR